MSYKGAVLIIILISVLLSGCLTANVVKEPSLPTLQPTSSSTISTFSIKGAVHDYKGAPISNAKVTLWRDGVVVNLPENPQYSGSYEFRNVPSGDYKVVAEKDGQSGLISYAGYGSTDIFILNSNQNQGTPLPTQFVTPYPTQTPSASTEYYQRTYKWTYKGTQWTDSLSIPKSMYDYYKGQPHDRRSNYAGYALSEYDRTSMKTMISDFRDVGARSGYSEYDNVMNIVCFVQSLPYTSDAVTTGYDEYPRYPIETLVDNGGDCEDTAILTASLLNEMGFGVVLIRLPGHMAVGVKCSDDYPGTYYEYKGAKYY
jgi:predicted transglutaminase-like cysteine proteinase